MVSRGAPGAGGAGAQTGRPRRVLAVVADSLDGPEPAEAILNAAGEGGIEVRVVVPAVEDSQFHHLLGDADDSSRVARARLEASLDSLRRNGVQATGSVGESDPVVAAEDELRMQPADEVLIFEHDSTHERWFEHGLLDKARDSIPVPLRMIVVSADEDGETRVVEVERPAPGPAPHDEEVEISDNLPRFAPGDLSGMVIGVVGTIVAIVLAAAGPGPESGAGAASILIAMGVALINMAHVVGLTLLESVHHRGGFARFFRTLSLVGTPSAVLANLLILLLA